MKTSRAGQLALFFCPFLTYLLLNCEYWEKIPLMLVDSSVRRALGITLKGFGTHLSIAKIQKFR